MATMKDIERRTCGICGETVAEYSYTGRMEWTPLGQRAARALVEINMGAFGRGGRSDYRCRTHSGQSA